jgi:ESX secretion-associated protein EspD/H
LTDDPLPADFDDDDLPPLSFYAPDGHDAVDEDDEVVVPTMFTVTNPPGTVTVSTFMDGSVQRIDLSQEVISMTEADLADEIVVIARLATQDARAAQYVHVLDGMRQQGHDDVATRDFLSRDLDLPSPEDASAARARVFATRYAGDHE